MDVVVAVSQCGVTMEEPHSGDVKRSEARQNQVHRFLLRSAEQNNATFTET